MEVVSRGMDARRRLPKDLVQDCYSSDLVSNPVTLVRSIWSRVGVEVTPAYEARMREYLCEHPANRNGPHLYRSEDQGLRDLEILDRFRDYLEVFEPQREGAAVT